MVCVFLCGFVVVDVGLVWVGLDNQFCGFHRPGYRWGFLCLLWFVVCGFLCGFVDVALMLAWFG